MRVFQLTVSGEVVDDGDFSGRFGLGLGPNFGSLWTGFSVSPFLGNLKLRRYPSPGTRTHRHFSSLQNLDGRRVVAERRNREQ